MFNLKNTKKAQITSEEKYLRQQNVGPKADDNQAIWEKELPHRDGYEQTTTEDQMDSQDKTDIPIIEKVLNEAQSYIPHRSEGTWLSVPPVAALVEKLRQKRLADHWETQKESHWSQSADEGKQQGALPKFPKNPAQHDKPVLNNDPARFKKLESMPIHEDHSKNRAALDKSNKIQPLVGNITAAMVDDVVQKIKTGRSIDFDTAIVAILREAEQEKRELNSVEKKAVEELKIARTKSMLIK